MAGPCDQSWLPGNRVRFGSLDFIIGARSGASDIPPCLFLVSGPGVATGSVERIQWEPSPEHRTDAEMTQAVLGMTTQCEARSPSFHAGYEMVERRLVEVLCPWLAPWGEKEILRTITCVISPTLRGGVSLGGLPDPW